MLIIHEVSDQNMHYLGTDGNIHIAAEDPIDYEYQHLWEILQIAEVGNECA